MAKLDQTSVIVLGGSFNPPTIAHEKLMLHALAESGAGIGIFVPSSENYVARKCRKIKENLLFSEQTRLKMLLSIVDHHENLFIETGEYGDDGKGRSYDTMVRIQRQHPMSKCAFIIGADNLHIIPRWHNNDDFFRDFFFIVVSRNQQDVEKVIRSNDKLRRFRDKLILVPELDDTVRSISSTKARNLLKQKPSLKVENELRKILSEEVIQIARESMKEVL